MQRNCFPAHPAIHNLRQLLDYLRGAGMPLKTIEPGSLKG